MNAEEVGIVIKFLCQWVEEGKLSFLEAHAELENCNAIVKACYDNGWIYDFNDLGKRHEITWSIYSGDTELINSYSSYVISFIKGYNYGDLVFRD